MYEVIMPKLGMTMEKGLIERWLKKEGDYVEKGEPLLEVMTDKVTIEVESFHNGYLKKILAKEGEEIPVTEVIAYIGEKDEKISEEIIKGMIKEKGEEKIEIKRREEEKVLIEEKPKYKVEEEIQIEKILKYGKEEEIEKAKVKKILASPLAKRLARQMKVDLSKVTGTGPGGRIVKADVLKAAKEVKMREAEIKEKEKIEIEREIIKKRITPEILETIPLKGIRKTIAERMYKSISEIPHFTLYVEIDISNLESLKDKLNKEIEGKKISYTDLIVKATALSLEKYPILNSTLKDDKVIIFKDINVGLATSMKDGLIVPVIFNANKLSLEEIADKRVDLVNRAGENKLELDDVSGSTFTITNLGMFEIDYFFPIINFPEAGILSVGAITKKPIVDKEGKITAEPMMKLGLTLDHRVLDGVTGAKFLQYLRKILQEPNKLV